MILPATKKEFAIPSIIRPVDDSCVLWIKGSDSRRVGTVLADLSKKGNTGKIVGATWVNSPIGHSVLSFDGVDDYVEVADSPSLRITTAITIEAWIKPNSLTDGQEIVNKMNPGGGYELLFHNGGLSAYGGTDGIFYRIQTVSYSNLVQGAWNYVVWTFDTTTDVTKMYINGVVFSGSSTVSIGSSTNKIGIGNWWNGGSWNRPFNGLINEVRIYNRALSASEIREQYNYLKSFYA